MCESEMSMIELENVSMMFNLASEWVDNIKEYLIRLVRRDLHFQEFWALRDISFTVGRGDALGVVGLNGSGKSTLLKLVAGIMKPTSGSVKVSGQVAPMIELGAGFDLELSARENIYLNGMILGYTRKHITERYEKILDFAELREFEMVPVKNFSSGMTARLGFAIATLDQPDILILDEVLAVGDYQFQEKSMARTQEIIDNGATVLLVSHDIEQVKKLCQKALWLEKGHLKMIGDVDEVCARYQGEKTDME